MRTRIFVVDAFTSKPFSGNPAGVCLLQGPREDEWMQALAAEMKHAETAFVRFTGEFHELRWFTPTTEVDLCGHATLAAAHVLWSLDLHSKWQPIKFKTKSGILSAIKQEEQGVLDFPAEIAHETEQPANLSEILGCEAVWFGKNRMDYIAELPDEDAVRAMKPNFDLIEAMGMRGLIVTAESHSTEVDFVSRFFAPQAGIPEDPVTGSAHCCLGPYWSEKLGEDELVGYQCSERGGKVGVRCRGERVDLVGRAVTVIEGVLHC